MSEHSEDSDFKFSADGSDPFESIPEDAPAHPDAFDELSNEENSSRVYPAVPDDSPMPDDRADGDGGIGPAKPETNSGPKRPGRPWFKIVAGVVFVLLVCAGGVIYGLGRFKGEPPGQVAANPPGQVAANPPGQVAANPSGQVAANPSGQVAANPSGQGSANPSGEAAANPSGQAAVNPSGQVAVNPTGTPPPPESLVTNVQTPLRSVAELKKDLESSTATVKRKALQDFVKLRIGYDATSIAELKLFLDASERLLKDNAANPVTNDTIEDEANNNILRLRWKRRGVMEESTPSAGKSDTRLPPANLDEPAPASATPMGSALPLRYAFVVAAIFGAVDPAEDERRQRTIEQTLEQLTKIFDEQKKLRSHLLLTTLYLESAKLEEAIEHLDKAEFYAQNLKNPDDLEDVESARRAVIDYRLTMIRRETLEKQDALTKAVNLRAKQGDLNTEKVRIKTLEDDSTKLKAAERLATLETEATNLTKKGGRIETLEGVATKFDDAVRQSIRSLLAQANLSDRLSQCKPTDENAKMELAKAAKDVENKSKEEYLNNVLAKLQGNDLWVVYEGLREIEVKLVAWETRQSFDVALGMFLDSTEAKKTIAELVHAGILTEKNDPKGLLAEIKGLLGKTAIEQLIEDKIIATPGQGGSGGISALALEARVKKAEALARQLVCELAERLATEEKTHAMRDDELSKNLKTLSSRHDQLVETSNQFSRALEDATKAIGVVRGELKTARTELEAKIEQPRPIPKDQIEELQRGLAGNVEKSVADELARRGVMPVELPVCKMPAGPTSEANRKKATYYFGEGCTHFYRKSNEQMPAATRCFSEATTLNPNDPIYRYYLGCSLYYEGRQVEGQEQIRCAAEIEKKSRSQDAIPGRLERIQFGVRQWLERTRQSVLLGL